MGISSGVAARKNTGNTAVEITREYEELAQSNITQPKIALLSSFIFVQLAGKLKDSINSMSNGLFKTARTSEILKLNLSDEK